MKKTYFSPEVELVELEIETSILFESGGGIADDNTANTSDDEVDNPSEEFGWNEP